MIWGLFSSHLSLTMWYLPEGNWAMRRGAIIKHRQREREFFLFFFLIQEVFEMGWGTAVIRNVFAPFFAVWEQLLRSEWAGYWMLDWQRHLSGSVKGPLETIVQIKQCSFTGELANTPSSPPLTGLGAFVFPVSFWVSVQHNLSLLQPQLCLEGNPLYFLSWKLCAVVCFFSALHRWSP